MTKADFYAPTLVRMFSAILVLGMLSACEADARQDFYYFMEFDAEVEGERFTFDTKIACKPKSAPTGDGERRLYFSTDRYSFGKKLKSGKGVFVAAPDICSIYYDEVPGRVMPYWALPEPEKGILPAIYVTDNYENPSHLTFYSNPNGPEPRTGVRLIRCAVRPLSGAQAAATQDRPLDKQDPFLRTDPKSSVRPHAWHAFAFFPLSIVDSARVRAQLGEMILETSGYRLHHQPEHLRQMFPGLQTPLSYASGYWQVATFSVPLNEALHSFRRSKRLSSQGSAIKEAEAYLAREGFSTNLPVRYDGEVFSVDFENTGILYAFSAALFSQKLVGNRIQQLVIAGKEADFDWHPRSHRQLILHNLKTGRLYAMFRPLLKMKS
jgi:hypothetical protein